MKIIVILALIGGGIYLWFKNQMKKMDEKKKANREYEKQANLPKDKLKLLAVGAIIHKANDDTTKTLEATMPEADVISTLDSYWGIFDTKSAKETIEDLLNGKGKGARANDWFTELKTFNNFKELEKLHPEIFEDDEDGSEEDKYKNFYKLLEKEIVDYTKTFQVEKLDGTIDKSGIEISPEQVKSVKNLNAWDIGRAGSLARWCFSAKYITEAEAWSYLKQAQEQAKKGYRDWTAFGLSYCFGRFITYDPSYFMIFSSVCELLKEEDSIWLEFPLNR